MLDDAALRRMSAWWHGQLGAEAAWPVTDLWEALLRQFVDGPHFDDPQAFAALRGRSCSCA